MSSTVLLLIVGCFMFLWYEICADTSSSQYSDIDPPNLKPGQYRLQFRTPDRCSPGTGECDVFVGINTNSGDDGFLDIYLEGQYSGWVGVGFTKSPSMFSADVVVCNKDPSNQTIVPVDAWNPPSGRSNIPNPLQNITLFTGQLQNGAIMCSVSKSIAPVDSDYDLDLNDKYYVLFGGSQRDSDDATHISQHTTTPSISDGTFNPVVDRGEGQFSVNVRPRLIRLHGILMIIAWPILAMTGLYFASWMRPALPPGQWFQVHRALMLIALFVLLAGLIPIFVAYKDNPTRGLIELGSTNGLGTAHFIIGLIAVALHITNPILAIFRCKPDHPKRWIFNIFHARVVGLMANILAMTNVGIGLFLFGFIPVGNTWLWPFIVYNVHQVLWIGMVVVLVVIFYIYPGSKGQSSDYSVTAAYNTSDEKARLNVHESVSSDTTQPSSGGRKKLRWSLFAVFFAALLVANLVIIILVAV